MFGMGFSELLVIAVIAILFLGPDKLPSALVDIAKFFRSVKQTVNSVKDSINEEIHMEDIKKEAAAYKQQLLEAQTKVNSTVNLSSLDEDINSLINDAEKIQPKTKTTDEIPPATKIQEEKSLEKENKDA